MRMRTVTSILTLIAGTAGLCVDQEDVARICTARTDIGFKLSQGVMLENLGNSLGYEGP